MALQLDLSRSPYFDDFNPNANFYQVLFRPGTAVQTRELNAMQSILQDQISKFGRNLIKDGSVTEGCAFTFDNNYQYVKINDNYANSTAFTITDFIGDYVYNSNGLKALIVNTTQGYQSQDPNLNTLYIKYINTATFTNGSPQSAFSNNDNLVVATSSNVSIGNVTVATVANSTGAGYAFTTTNGTIFKDGYFINVLPQTEIVTAYNNYPDNISIGFEADENIITPEANSSLYDNAAGSPNYLAPGAHRLQLIPNLVTRQTNAISNTISFFSLCDFVAGKPVSIKNNTQYAQIEAEMAKRTYDTNGDFVVTPFVLSTQAKPSSDPLATNYLNLISSRGEGYVEGYNVDFINNNIANLRKATDTETFKNSIVTANFGYYTYVNEFAGDFNTDNVVQVELHSVAKQSITSGSVLSVGYSSTTKIGTAYLRGFKYDSGTIGSGAGQYRAYLFNVSLLPGYNFLNVKSIIYYNSSVLGVADTVQQYINNSNTATGAVLQQPIYGKSIFPIGQKATVANGFNNTQFVYRNRANSNFSTLATGSMSVSLGSVKGSATETLNVVGTETGSGTTSFIVVPTTTGYSSTKSGNVSVTSGQSNIVYTVSGTATQFLSEYMVGDYIYINGQVKRITLISNNTQMTVNGTFSATNTNSTHQKTFPAGIPLDFTKSNGTINRSIVTTSSTATFTLGETVNATFQASAYFDVLRAATVPVKKVINKHTYVAINCASHSNTSKGPWSLGFVDVNKINAIYVSSGSFSNSGTNYLTSFSFDSGQRDAYYGLAQISSLGANYDSTTRILVDLDVFTYDQSQGVGFFSANSYPVDDANTANTNAIQTKNIPQYQSTDGSLFDLRDSIDFRPWANNTSNSQANSTNWASAATINPSSTLTFYVDPAYGAYLPSSDSNFQSDISHYFARRDLAVVTTTGQFKVVEGTPSKNPAQPVAPNGTMALAVIDVPPYPSLSTPEAAAVNRYDYAVTATLTQNKRYTMKDINSLSNKIDNLEYYTSLSLLEQTAASTLVRSGTTGQNRFQNGILVDPFHDHSIGNTNDPTYNIAIDPITSQLRPAFVQMQYPLSYNASLSSNTTQVGKYVMLNYTENAYLSQSYASKYRNCIEGNIYTWNGTISFNPPGDTSPDLTTSPNVVTNIDLASNWVNLAAAFGTQWGNWNTINTSTTTATNPATLTSSTTDQYGNVIQKYNTATTTTLTTTQQQNGTQFSTTTGTNQYNLGTYVTNVSILPYVKSIEVSVTVHGLKPNTRVYAFINNLDVNAWFRQCDNAFTPSLTKAFGSSIISDAQGNVYGKFTIPASTFTASTLVMQLVDTPNLITGASAITTQATGTFYATNISVSKGSSILSAREAVLNTTQVTQQQNIVTSTVTNQASVNIIAAPPIIVYYPPNYNGGGDGGGGHGGWNPSPPQCGQNQTLADGVCVANNPSDKSIPGLGLASGTITV